MPSVELFHWNPMRPVMRGPIGRRLPFRARVNNFGDMLGPAIVRKLLQHLGINESEAVRDERLFSIGSVLHEARTGDHVWGSGVNGKELNATYNPHECFFHAVRGPLTRSFLTERGALIPEIYGDPGILTSRLFPIAELPAPCFVADVLIVPNLHDYARYAHLPNVLNPRRPLLECLATIAASGMVVGSSLHGTIVAESYGIGARPVLAKREPSFKYDDYFAGTGRAPQASARNVKEARAMGPVSFGEPRPDALLDAFPRELWSK